MSHLSKSTKVWLILFCISVAFLFMGYKLSGRLGLFFGLILAISFNFLIFYFRESQILRLVNAQQVLGQDPFSLCERVRLFSKKLGVPAPMVYVTKVESAVAFSVGRTWDQGSICLSNSLLEVLTAAEVDAVIALLIAKIQRMDTLGLGIVHMLAYPFIRIGLLGDQLMPPYVGLKNPLLGVFLLILFPLIWVFFKLVVPAFVYLLLKFAVTERVFFENDDLAASIIADRRPLAEAIWKLNSLNQLLPMQNLPPCSSHFFVVNPMGLEPNKWFLLTHPNIEIRVKRLIGYFPI